MKRQTNKVSNDKSIIKQSSQEGYYFIFTNNDILVYSVVCNQNNLKLLFFLVYKNQTSRKLSFDEEAKYDQSSLENSLLKQKTCNFNNPYKN